LKFLVIAALFLLLLLLVYSRLYPYIQALQKLFGAAKTINGSPFNSGAESRSPATKGDRKLVKCVGCGTWIPVERAIGNRAGQSVYCSRECIEKASNGKQRKMAG
jgi:hypothetical protein